MTKYCYVYTGDKNKEERIKRINQVLDVLKDMNEDVVFAVNDLQSIAYLKEKGFRALNIDAIQDLFNLVTHDDILYICTPEEKNLILASYANAKEIC
jgi:ATP phosphoribosyltransferase regulatory subunit HisZ